MDEDPHLQFVTIFETRFCELDGTVNVVDIFPFHNFLPITTLEEYLAHLRSRKSKVFVTVHK